MACKMEKEIPLIAMVYIERLLTKTGLLINHMNWRRIVLIALCIGSKIWDDDSLENVHFPKVMKDVTLKEINRLERVFLEFLSYELGITGPEYAKYFFILRTLAQEQFGYDMDNGTGEKRDKKVLNGIGEPIAAEKMRELQKKATQVEEKLKDKHINRNLKMSI
jgi:hypothetical protein